MIEIFWNSELNTPIIIDSQDKKTKSMEGINYMAKDLRPVFLEEKK